jgi:hypothetical protein
MKLNRALMGCAVGVATLAGPAMAAGPTISEVLANSGITANGWISGSYIYGSNEVAGEPELIGHAFDAQTDSFQLNQAVLNISALPTEGFGGLVTLLAGEDAELIAGSYGDGNSRKIVANQAYVQYASGALTVIGGRYNTLAGAEVIADPLNANVTRSLLFSIPEPLVHTGVRASYKVSDQFTGYLGLANSALAGAADDFDRRKTLELGGYFALTPAIGIGVYDYYGDEVKGNTTNILDAVVTWQVSPALQLVLNGDWQKQDNDDGGADPEITGVAGYANYKISDRYRASLRIESVELDSDGPGDSTVRVESYTLTFGYAPAKNFELIGEGRVDSADEDVFIDDADPEDTQPELALKGIYKFGL